MVTYTIQPGTPAPFDVIACGKYYPERLDDVAWENDLGGFRAYGPALQARGERGFGYDLLRSIILRSRFWNLCMLKSLILKSVPR